MLADRSRPVVGHAADKPTSLADIGYSDAGIDDGWQKCGSYGAKSPATPTAPYRYHSGLGAPVVDERKVRLAAVWCCCWSCWRCWRC